MSELLILILGFVLMFGVGWLAVDYSKMHTDFDYLYNVEIINQAVRIRELEERVKELEGEK